MKSTHIGIEYNLCSFYVYGTTTATTGAWLQMGRSTVYGLMVAGMDGVNGLTAKASIQLYNMYVLPKIPHSLESIHLNLANICKLELNHRKLIREIQGPPKEVQYQDYRSSVEGYL